MTFDTSKLHNHQSAHLAFCGLTALLIARKSDGVVGAAREHTFLFNWLNIALKQKRFSKSVATDLRWLIEQGRKYQLQARLKEKLEYLWKCGSGELHEQSDLYRLNVALDTAQNASWVYSLLDEGQWKCLSGKHINQEVGHIRIRQSTLAAGFNEDGDQVTPIEAVITGNVTGLNNLLYACLWEFNFGGSDIPFYCRGKAFKSDSLPILHGDTVT